MEIFDVSRFVTAGIQGLVMGFLILQAVTGRLPGPLRVYAVAILGCFLAQLVHLTLSPHQAGWAYVLEQALVYGLVLGGGLATVLCVFFRYHRRQGREP